VQLDRAVAWPIETRGGRVDIPLEVRFFAPDELEVLDATTAVPSKLRRALDTVRVLDVLRDSLAPELVAAGFALVEDVDDDTIGCLEYQSGTSSDPVALAVTHVPAASLIRAELWRPRRLTTVLTGGWHIREETWHHVPNADPHGLACQVATTVGRWLDVL
jgi:hypothetical protein